MDLIERFRYIMKLNNLNASAFAETIGVQASSVSHILSGRNKPSLEFIQKVLAKYPKVDASWLINGTTKVSSEKEDFQLKANSEVKEEDQAVYNRKTQKRSEIPSNRKVSKVLVFYSDGTFEEFTSIPS